MFGKDREAKGTGTPDSADRFYNRQRALVDALQARVENLRNSGQDVGELPVLIIRANKFLETFKSAPERNHPSMTSSMSAFAALTDQLNLKIGLLERDPDAKFTGLDIRTETEPRPQSQFASTAEVIHTTTAGTEVLRSAKDTIGNAQGFFRQTKATIADIKAKVAAAEAAAEEAEAERLAQEKAAAEAAKAKTEAQDAKPDFSTLKTKAEKLEALLANKKDPTGAIARELRTIKTDIDKIRPDLKPKKAQEKFKRLETALESMEAKIKRLQDKKADAAANAQAEAQRIAAEQAAAEKAAADKAEAERLAQEKAAAEAAKAKTEAQDAKPDFSTLKTKAEKLEALLANKKDPTGAITKRLEIVKNQIETTRPNLELKVAKARFKGLKGLLDTMESEINGLEENNQSEQDEKEKEYASVLKDFGDLIQDLGRFGLKEIFKEERSQLERMIHNLDSFRNRGSLVDFSRELDGFNTRFNQVDGLLRDAIDKKDNYEVAKTALADFVTEAKKFNFFDKFTTEYGELEAKLAKLSTSLENKEPLAGFRTQFDQFNEGMRAVLDKLEEKKNEPTDEQKNALQKKEDDFRALEAKLSTRAHTPEYASVALVEMDSVKGYIISARAATTKVELDRLLLDIDALLENLTRKIDALPDKEVPVTDDQRKLIEAYKNEISSLEARLRSKVSTSDIDGRVTVYKGKIAAAKSCIDKVKLDGMLAEMDQFLTALVDDIDQLKTKDQQRRLKDHKIEVERISKRLGRSVASPEMAGKVRNLADKITAAEVVVKQSELEPLLTEIDGLFSPSFYDDLNKIRTLDQQAEVDRATIYRRDFNVLVRAINTVGGKKMVDSLQAGLGRIDGFLNNAERDSIDTAKDITDIIATVNLAEENLGNFINEFKIATDKKMQKVYEEFQNKLRASAPPFSPFLESGPVQEEKTSILSRVGSRIGGWLGFGKKKPVEASTGGSTPSPAAPKRSVLGKIKDAVINKETGKFSAKLAYNTFASAFGVKLITDGLLAIGGKGDLAEYYRGAKQSKVTVNAIMEAYQKLMQSSEKEKKGESVPVGEEVATRFAELLSKIQDTELSPAAKQDIQSRIWGISKKHEGSVGKAVKERDAEVKRLLEAYIHAKVSGAQIAKDGLNTLLTALGGVGLRAIGYAGASIAERIQKSKREHTRHNAGQIEEKNAFFFVAKDATLGAMWETMRSLRGVGAKEGASRGQKIMDFAKAAGILFRAFGIYGTVASGNTEKNIDTLIERIKSGNVLRVNQNVVDNFKSVYETYRHPLETVEKIGHKIKAAFGDSETSHGALGAAATEHVAESRRATEAALAAAAARHTIPEPGSGGSTQVEAPETHVELSAVQEFGPAHKLDITFYPHLEKLVSTDQFPELNNEQSLTRILAAEKAGAGIHSHHKFIKYEINTMVESGAERQQVIFEEILEKGGPARAAEYLKQLNFSRPQLTYIREWVGRGKSTEINWQAFAEKYKAESNTNHEMVQGLWRSMQGEETQDIMNAGLAGKGIDSHIHGQIYYGGVENGKPIISAVEGHDGYITKDQMKLVPNADKQIVGKAQDVSPDKIAPRITRPVVDVSYYPEDGAQPTDALQPARTRITEMVDTKGPRGAVSAAVRVRTLETFRPSGTLVEVPDSAGKAATAEKIPATDKGQSGEVLANVMKDTLGKAGARAEKFAKGIATDVGSMFESNGSDQITPDNTVTTIDTQLKENLALFNARADQYVNAVQAAYSNMQNGFDYKGSGADLVREQFNNNFRTPMEYILKSQKGVALTSDEKMAVNNFVDTLKRGVNSSEGIKGEELLLARDSGADKLQIVANGSRAFRIKKPDGSGEILFGSDEFKFKTTPTGKLLKIGAQGVPVGKPMSYDEALALADPEHYPLLATK